MQTLWLIAKFFLLKPFSIHEEKELQPQKKQIVFNPFYQYYICPILSISTATLSFRFLTGQPT
jgi:hypothetical protein